MPSNTELIPIYTDWANRCLSKAHQQPNNPSRGVPFKPINDLTNEIRDYRLLTTLIKAIEPENSAGADQFARSLSQVTTNIDGINVCLEHLTSFGVNVTKVTARDIDAGQLGAVLQLIYALSHYKNQQKLNKKKTSIPSSLPPQPPPSVPPPAPVTQKMPPSTLPQPGRSSLAPPQSRLMPPSKFAASPKATPSVSPSRTKSNLASAANNSTGLKPPTSRIQPPTRTSGNNNGSTLSSRCSSVASSATYSSIPSTSGNRNQTTTQTTDHSTTSSNLQTSRNAQRTGLQPPAAHKLPATQSPKTKSSSVAKTGLRAPSTIVQTISSATSSGHSTPSKSLAPPTPLQQNQPKMLKLKLFGKDKEKKDKSPKTTPITSRKSDSKLAAPTATITSVAPPKVPSLMTKSKMTGLKTPAKIAITPKKESQPVTLRRSIGASTQHLTSEVIDKRTSKSSEEDSAYAGFGSVSPGSSGSPSSSMSMPSAQGSKEKIYDDPPREQDEKREQRMSKMQPPRVKSVEEKPTMAVKGIAAPSATRLNKPAEALTKEPKREPLQPQPSPITSPQKSLQSPTVGVVSPMLNQRKLEAMQSPPSTSKEPSPSPSVISQTTLEKKRPPVPHRTSSRLETTFDSDLPDNVSTSEIPSMAPIRQPPSYDQLLSQGRIGQQRSRLGQFVDSSTSEDSLDSVSTTIRCRPALTGYQSEGDLDRPGPSHGEPGYASESGIAIYAKMQAKLKEYGDTMRRRGDYNDSFEDSSSISSGISENFDDLSTDDLTGSSLSDHAMAAVTAYGKIGDYGHFVRGNGTKGPRSSSSSIEQRQRRLVEQENIHQLLQQCRTSQRGAGCNQQTQYHTLGGGVPHLALSADGDTLSVQSRSSLRVTPKRQERQGGPPLNGYHSLDRKYHMAALYQDESTPHRLSVFEQRAAMALVSPRRIPNHGPPDSMQRHSVNAANQLNASGMSRSMVLLEAANGSSSPHMSRSKRAASPRTTARLPLSVASPVASPHKGSLSARKTSDGIYANCGGRDPNLHLHRLTEQVQRSPSHSSVPRDKTSPGSDFNGSSLSLASSTAYNTLAEKYESELRKMNHELDGYRNTVHKLTKKHDDYTQLIDTFNSKLSHLGKHVEKAQLKPEELHKLRLEIENLRQMSGRVANEKRSSMDGAGELLRQPSLESVASHRSSMSSSSKSSKTDKSSLNSFGRSKKSWVPGVETQIRSSFSKAFTRSKKNKNGGSDTEGSPMHHGLNTISGSSSRLDDIEVVELKRQLEARDYDLTDVRLDALERAREVDVLKETINKLRSENKHLKQEMARVASAKSRASSQASLQLLGEEDPVYEMPPNSSGSYPSSKRSSGCNTVKVTVNVDLVGSIRAAICPDNEITIGYLALPGKDSSWDQLDAQIYALFDDYISRIDPDRHLGLHCSESVIGYQMGETVRERNAENPSATPGNVITTTTTIRMFLRGATQHSVDSLVLECLFPRSMLDQLLKFLLGQRRLVLSGATGIGKSNLAKQLAAYLSIRVGSSQDAVVDIKIPDDASDKALLKVEKQLEAHLRAPSQTVVLLDNIPRHRIAFVSSVFDSVQMEHDKGPFVICTVNRACQLPEMQVHHNFKMFLLTNRMDGVKGFMGRFLRRKIIESEFRLARATPPELLRVIQFLPMVLQAVNSFIEKANSLDVTVGPRIFLQCPLGVDESRDWFVRLWNQNIVPYMVKVGTEGVKILGRCGSFEDPTDMVCEHWPWLEGPSGEELLHRLSFKDAQAHNVPKQPLPFNPLETLIRLQAAKNHHTIMQENL